MCGVVFCDGYFAHVLIYGGETYAYVVYWGSTITTCTIYMLVMGSCKLVCTSTCLFSCGRAKIYLSMGQMGLEYVLYMAECNAWWGVIWGWKLGVHMCGDYCVAECSTRLGVIVGLG